MEGEQIEGKEDERVQRNKGTDGGRIGNITFHYTPVLDVVDEATLVGTYDEIPELPGSEG
jgi:hypothetical protein